MADVKWFKLSNTMFDDEKIEYLESLPDGDALINIWVKTLCLASKCNNQGYLTITEEVPYTLDMLANKFRKTGQQVKYAFALMEKLGMLSMLDNIVSVSNWAKYQDIDGLESIREYNRLKQRESRARIKENQELLPDVNDNVNDKVNDAILYSYSNTLINIIDKYNFGALVKEQIQKWIKYKAEKKNSYKQIGFDSFCKRIKKELATHSESDFIESIDYCMENNWQGFFWKDKPKSRDKSEEPKMRKGENGALFYE